MENKQTINNISKINHNANDKAFKNLKEKLSKEQITLNKFENQIQTNFEFKTNLFNKCIKDILKKSNNKRFKCKIKKINKVNEIINDELDSIVGATFDYNGNLFSINIHKFMLEIFYSKYKNFDNLLEIENQNIANLIYFLFGNF